MTERAARKRAGRPPQVGPPVRKKPLLPIPRKDLGPAMLALPNDQWRAACIARFEVRTNSEAMRLAGYGEDCQPNSVKRHAFNVFHDPRMLAALHEVGEKRLKEGVPDAIAAVFEIIGDREHKDRLSAARILLDRAHPVESLSRLVVEHKIDYQAQALDELRAFRKLGVTREKLEQIFGRDGLFHLEQQLDGPKMIDITPETP